MKEEKSRYIYDVKTPRHQGRSSFAITQVEKSGTKVISRKTIKDERIRAINLAYKSEFKDYDECLDEIKKIKNDYVVQEDKRKPKKNYNSKNLELVQKYFNKTYKKKKIKDESKKSMLKDLERSVKALGKLSLFSASEDEIQEQIDSQFSGDKQRRIIARLRQLLKFIGRSDIQLFLEEKDEKCVKYLEPNELDLLLDYIKENRILYCLVNIGARGGLRQSEIYGIRKHCLKTDRNLFVDTQLLPDGTRRTPKNKKKRTAFLMDGVSDSINEWLDISMADREAYRAGAARIPKQVKKACQKLFPNNPSKHLNFHDLRHCYAIYLVSIGMPTDLVAKFMGNSPEVCRLYYQGFMVSNTGIETAIAIFEKSKNG
jgi:integrase